MNLLTSLLFLISLFYTTTISSNFVFLSYISANITTMQKIMSITSQGQITIPLEIRQALNITQATKALVLLDGEKIVITPRLGFEQLAGSLASNIKLSDDQLRKARKSFEKDWARDEK